MAIFAVPSTIRFNYFPAAEISFAHGHIGNTLIITD